MVRQVTVKLKEELVCRKCGATWKHTTGKTHTECPFCGAYKDARDRREEAKQYLKSDERKEKLKTWYDSAENRRERGVKHRTLLRKRIFFRISGSIEPRCVRCGCDDPRLLEINHKNGGGNREMESGENSPRFYYDIAIGKRATDDLELLCKPCNAVHALELRFGELPFKVVWKP